MARIRTIKPEFFTSADVTGMSPLARLLFIGLWGIADREGRMKWRPADFKLQILPGDNCDINALCQEIVDGGMIVLYGDGLAHIPSFLDHQSINPRETISKLPAPDASVTRAHASNLDVHAQRGREGKGKEGNTSVDKSTEDIGSRDEDAAYELFVKTASEFGWPKPRGLEADRRKKLKARLGEHGLEGWQQMLENARASDFLRTKFALKLDWVLEPRNFRKVLEGNYGAACEHLSGAPSSDEILWEARFRNYHPGGMWQEATWGPRPESGRCIAPKPVLERWRGRVAQ